MCAQLHEVPLFPSPGPIPESPETFAEEGLRRARSIDCFDFVPSDYSVLYRTLSELPRGRLCEWGSGIGIGVGLATFLGFESNGIEINPELAAASRRLLSDFGLAATVTTGSYFEEQHSANIYFTYCWPGQMLRVEQHFLQAAPCHARLLICHGAKDIRCKVKVRAPRSGRPL